MRWIATLLSPWGRIGRAAFWVGIVTAAMLIVLPFVGLVVFIIERGKQDVSDLVVGLAAIGLMMVACYVSTVACAKRFNDRGKSSWWLFLGFVPVLGPLWLLIELGVLPGEGRQNRYGASPHGSGADLGAIFDDQPFTIVASRGRASNLIAILLGWIATIVSLASALYVLFKQP